MIEADPKKPLVVDEFTSVVDRQVAKIGAHAVQKWVRRNKRQFVAVTCHFDVIDWLQPDWILEPATMAFRREGLQQTGRPQLEVTIARVPYSAWRLFAPYHYLTASLNKSARCYGLFVGEEPAAFCGVLPRPHPKTKNIRGISRVVTLPDWQGLGLAFVLIDRLGAAYKASGYRLHNYPAHSAFIHAMDRSPLWTLKTKPLAHLGSNMSRRLQGVSHELGRPCAVFEYVGPADYWDAIPPRPVKKALPGKVSPTP
jgi:GNAT superfamily N-acetyltransferase